MENKAETYRKMLAYLEDAGANLDDLAPHKEAKIASATDASFEDMNRQDLRHYQSLLEATIDNRNAALMDSDILKDELTEVVRERFAKGGIKDKTAEARSFRNRLASL